MEKEQDSFLEDKEFQETLRRFEDMLRFKRLSFFDVYDFERIIDHYLDGNHFNRAIEAVTLGVRQHPGSTALLIKEAQVYAEKGESQKALDMVHSLEVRERTNPEVYLLKGMIMNQMGKTGMAEKAFGKALEYSYDNPVDTLYDIALSYEYVNQFRLAIRYLEEAHRKKPGRLSIISELAYCYDRLHDFEKSAEYYEAYLDLEPYSENAWTSLGLLYFKKENFRKAVECYDFAIAINENYAAAVFYKANALANLEDHENAIQSYKDCIRLEPENVLAHCYIGETYEKLEDYREASEWYEKAIRIDPSFSDAWYGIAVCYLFRKLYKDALYYVKKAISLDNENPDFWFTLGNVHDHLNDNKGAIRAYTRTTELDPYDDEAWISLARIHYKQGHLQRAIDILSDSYSHTFDIETVNYSLSAYYYLAGKLDQAVKFFKKGVTLNYSAHVLVEQISMDLLKEKRIQEILSKEHPLKNN